MEKKHQQLVIVLLASWAVDYALGIMCKQYHILYDLIVLMTALVIKMKLDNNDFLYLIWYKQISLVYVGVAEGPKDFLIGFFLSLSLVVSYYSVSEQIMLNILLRKDPKKKSHSIAVSDLM